ncbi:MAG: transposase [Chloroflexi bacterium]|nr:transposase [Chloroflexota bacterium]
MNTTTVRRAYQYRLYPNKGQTATLDWTLNRCRELYNAALEERHEAYRMCGVSVSYYDQKRQLPAIKEVRPEYTRIGSQVLQDVTRRLDKAFAAFFARIKEGAQGKATGYPRFKGKYRYNSFTLSQCGWKLPALDRGRLYVAGIGHLKLKWSRPIEGMIKTVTIKRDADQWYVTFSCEVEIERPPTPDRPAVGIDMGLEYYVTLSTGEHIENPRYYRKAQATIARRQRAFERTKKRVKLKDGTYRYGKNRARVGIALKKAHRHVANQRRDMQHKATRKIVAEYGAVAVEALSIDNMTKRPAPVKNDNGAYAPNGASAKAGLNKSIQDAAWGQFLSILRVKAEEAGLVYVAVNPSGTSQHCSGCGAKCPKTLSERWHACAACGLSIQRDHNAACNILTRAGLAHSVVGTGESHSL